MGNLPLGKKKKSFQDWKRFHNKLQLPSFQTFKMTVILMT